MTCRIDDLDAEIDGRRVLGRFRVGLLGGRFLLILFRAVRLFRRVTRRRARTGLGIGGRERQIDRRFAPDVERGDEQSRSA